MSRGNVHRFRPKTPKPEELLRTIRKLVKEGEYAFAMSDDDRTVAGGALNVPQALEILEFGDIDGEIVPGLEAGEWECQLVASLELRNSYAAVQTVVVRKEKLIVKSARWLN